MNPQIILATVLLNALLAISASSASEMDDAANDIQAGRYSEALAKLIPAAQNGNPLAMYNLGVMYRDGLGVPRDRERAKGQFLAAAQKGHALAQYGIARLYYDDGDFTQALLWYQKAANQGDLDALYNLGHMYHEGKGVSKDYARANQLFLEVADRGRFEKDGSRSYKAMDMLGNSYRLGETGRSDYVEAYKWYLLAAARGHPDALGQMRELERYLTDSQIIEAKKRVEEFANLPHP
jgi:TPR repeat protein